MTCKVVKKFINYRSDENLKSPLARKQRMNWLTREGFPSLSSESLARAGCCGQPGLASKGTLGEVADFTLYLYLLIN